jgi:chorismate-pyruvate lyase
VEKSRSESVNLDALVRLFYDAPDELGQFTEVSSGDMPQPYRKLLAHEAHMTVTVEAHHHDTVDVEVLARRVTPTHYARKIILRRSHDRHVVQYGIMRVNFAYLPAEVQAQIRSEQTPLGRILIEHNVLRRVQLFSLRRVALGELLAAHFQQPLGTFTYGRTALIECNQVPAIELLEIVAPIES